MRRATNGPPVPRGKNDMANIKAPPKPPEKSEAYEKCESLTKLLMQVPKKELDEKLAEFERLKHKKHVKK